jgi:hypothetical protein
LRCPRRVDENLPEDGAIALLDAGNEASKVTSQGLAGVDMDFGEIHARQGADRVGVRPLDARGKPGVGRIRRLVEFFDSASV